MAIMVWNPQSTKVATISLDLTRLSSLLLIYFIMSLSIVVMDSVVLTPRSVLIAFIFVALAHLYLLSTALILFIFFILSIINKQRQDII